MSDIHHAMLQLQQAPPRLVKAGTGPGYRYMRLEDIVGVVMPRLNALGCTVRWDTSCNHESVYVSCIVRHVESQSIVSAGLGRPSPTVDDCMIVGRDGKRRQITTPVQMLGGIVTYLRRYTLLCVLGLTDGLDNDGAVPSAVQVVTAAEADDDWAKDLVAHPDDQAETDCPY